MCGAHGARARHISINTGLKFIGINSVDEKNSEGDGEQNPDGDDKENSDCKTRANILQYILSYILILKVLQM